jgi:hypothetical protein
MRGTGGLYRIVHTTYSSCDDAWAGWVYEWIRFCFNVTVSSGNFMAFHPNWGLNLRVQHIRGSRRAVSEWKQAYLRQLIIQTVNILQLDSAITDSLPRGRVVRPFQPYFPIT